MLKIWKSHLLLFVVVNRDEPTTLAYLLLKVRVDSKGVISTQLNTRLSDKVEVRQ